MTHPSSLALEALACGEPRATVAAHVEECAACKEFVAQLRGVVAAGPSAAEADAIVMRAVAGMTRDVDAKAKAKAKATRIWAVASSVVVPLAAAAAIFLLVRTNPGTSPTTAPTAAPPDTIQMGEMPAREPDTQFKGGAQIAVVRERGREQARFSGVVRVRPGDRLRVEVALDREQAILGGVLAEDGTYLELMAQGVRGPGTHFSERSAKIDAAPTRGTIVVGSPDAVARARAAAGPNRLLEGVATLRVEWELGSAAVPEGRSP